MGKNLEKKSEMNLGLMGHLDVIPCNSLHSMTQEFNSVQALLSIVFFFVVKSNF